MRFAVMLIVLAVHAEPDERERHQGTWQAVSFVRDGKETLKKIVDSIERMVEGDHVVWKRDGKSFAGTTMELIPGSDPAGIDLLPDGGPNREKRVRGIDKIDGDVLTLCTSDPDQPRPKEFKAEPGSGRTLMTFRRMEKRK